MRRGARPWRGCGPRHWRRRGSAWPRNDYSNIVHKHAGEVANAILMHQELDPDGLAYPGAKVHRLMNPTFGVASLMEDGLENVSVGIGDVSVLIVGVKGIGAVPVPEA